MVQPDDFTTVRILASGFVSSEDLVATSVLSTALTEWPSVYDSAPLSLPLPAELPGEIPSVILSSKDGSYRLEGGRERVNFSWEQRGEAFAELNQTLSVFAHRLSTVFERANGSIGRFGIVVTRVAAVPEPGLVLSRQFCRDEWLQGPLNRPEGFELHAHKTFKLATDLRVNSWIRIRAALGQDQGYDQIAVEQDINTLVTERPERNFSRNQLQSAFTNTATELETILSQYFPTASESRETS